MTAADDRRRLHISVAFLALTRLVMNTSYRFVYPFLPAIARGLGIPLTTAGLLVSVRSLAGLATPTIVATIGRREGRRRLLGFGVWAFVLGSAVTATFGNVIGAVAGFVMVGLAKPVFDLAAQAYIADRTPYEVRARYLSLIELTWAGSLLVGAPAAGWLIRDFGWEAPFWTFAALGVVAALLLRPSIAADPVAGRAPKLTAGLTHSSLVLLGVIFAFNFAGEVVFVVVGAWLETNFDLSLVALGSAATVIALAELAGEGATFAFTDRLGKRRAVGLGLMLSAIGFLVLWQTAQFLVAGLIVFALTFAAFELTIVSAIPLATEANPGNRTGYLAWMMVAVGVSRALGAAIGPALYEWGGFGANTILSAAVDVAALAVLVGFVHETKTSTP